MVNNTSQNPDTQNPTEMSFEIRYLKKMLEAHIEESKNNTKAIQELTMSLREYTQVVSHLQDRFDKIEEVSRSNKERLDIQQTTISGVRWTLAAIATAVIGFIVTSLGK